MHHLHFKAFLKAWLLSHEIYKEQPFLFLWKNKIRFSLVSLLFAGDSTEWFEKLKSASWITPVLDKIPVLAFKPMRPYLSTVWDLKRKKKVIWDTYDLLRSYPVIWSTLLNDDGTVLASYQTGRIGLLEIVLCDCHHSTGKEGEVMVVLRNRSQNREVLKMTFSFEQGAPGVFNCYIGCIQGGAGIDNREEIKSITREMHGLRPAFLMIFVVREIIAAMNIDVRNLMGLGTRNHPFRKKHLIHLPFIHQISLDYDSLWAEAGGVCGEDGWFRLPLKQARRRMSEIKSKKKMLYQRRYAMMDDLAGQIRDSIGGRGCSGDGSAGSPAC